MVKPLFLQAKTTVIMDSDRVFTYACNSVRDYLLTRAEVDSQVRHLCDDNWDGGNNRNKQIVFIKLSIQAH
jgi:hypothetical protein